MFEDYLNEMRFVAWVAMLGAGASAIMLMIVLSMISDIKAKLGSKSEGIDEDKLAEAVAARLAKFAKRPANQPPPPPKD